MKSIKGDSQKAVDDSVARWPTKLFCTKAAALEGRLAS